METFWLHGHEKFDAAKVSLSSMNIEGIFESVNEPEFLQII
jgi:hypothetical protein